MESEGLPEVRGLGPDQDLIVVEDLLSGQKVILIIVSLSHQVQGLAATGLAVVVAPGHDLGPDLLHVEEPVPVLVPDLLEIDSL